MVKNLSVNAQDSGSIPGSGRSPGGNGNALQYVLPEKSHEQRSVVGYSPWSCIRVEHDLATKQHQKYNLGKKSTGRRRS